MEKWQCPQECPHQSDDSPWPHIRLFLLTLFAVGVLWGSKVLNQKDIESTDWAMGLVSLVLAANNPKAMHELSSKAAKKVIGGVDVEGKHE